MEQILCHLFGDYILQSDWMAMNKSKKSFPCFVHCLTYTLPFMLITQEWRALLVIFATHFVFDRWHFILRRLIWLKNHLNPKGVFPTYDKCSITGYYDNMQHELGIGPVNDSVTIKDIDYSPRLNYITMWLYIITDNFFHLTCNYLAIKYLG